MATEKKNKVRDEEEPIEDAAPVKERKPRKKKEAITESRWSKFKVAMADERVHKVGGLFLVLASVYLLVAFTSYLITWRIDQDLMARPWGEIFSPGVQVENWLGKLGALVGRPRGK